MSQRRNELGIDKDGLVTGLVVGERYEMDNTNKGISNIRVMIRLIALTYRTCGGCRFQQLSMNKSPRETIKP